MNGIVLSVKFQKFAIHLGTGLGEEVLESNEPGIGEEVMGYLVTQMRSRWFGETQVQPSRQWIKPT